MVSSQRGVKRGAGCERCVTQLPAERVASPV
jgi:hypothetical protein